MFATEEKKRTRRRPAGSGLAVGEAPPPLPFASDLPPTVGEAPPLGHLSQIHLRPSPGRSCRRAARAGSAFGRCLRIRLCPSRILPHHSCRRDRREVLRRHAGRQGRGTRRHASHVAPSGSYIYIYIYTQRERGCRCGG